MNSGPDIASVTTPLFFCGIKHSGKSTLGRHIARTLRYEFHDSDDLILAYLAETLNEAPVSIRTFYRQYGKERFMAAEYEAIARFLTRWGTQGKPLVLALGGGACDNLRLMAYLHEAIGSLCYIRQSERVLFSRIMRSGIPPFLECEDPESAFHRLFVERDSIYAAASDHLFSIEGDQSISASVSMILTTRLPAVAGEGSAQ